MVEENSEQAVDDSDESQASEASEASELENETGTESEVVNAEQSDEESVEHDGEGASIPQPANEPTLGNEIPIVEPTRVSSANGSEITTPITDISMLLDIPVTLSMEIGQTKISISELLKLGKDSVIELQRMANEPLDVLVNGTLVAHGEAVVVGDRFGIRLTDVISPQERLRKFG